MASSSTINNPPEGTENPEPTPLQKHSMFFDTDKDGIIYPWETYKGFRKIGSNIFFSLVGSIFIHLNISPKTRRGKGLHLLFPIEIKNIKFAMHRSDTGAFDAEGRFVPEMFEEIFRKHAHTHADAITSQELDELLKARRDPKDILASVGAFGEWKLLFFLAKDENGLLSKERLRGVFDGSLFEQMAQEQQSKKQT